MKNIPLLLGTLVVTVLLVVGLGVFFSKSAEPEQVDQVLLVGENPHIKGPQNAKVTIVEFSDFQCPGCKGTQPLVKQILDKYPNDVRLVYRHFPLVTIHPNAQMAAKASEAANTFGKFWEMHDRLFETQDEWNNLKTENDAKNYFVDLAEKLQIDKSEFQKRIDSQEVNDRVLQDVSLASKLNLPGTPSFFVNGFPAQDLATAVESAMVSQQ